MANNRMERSELFRTRMRDGFSERYAKLNCYLEQEINKCDNEDTDLDKVEAYKRSYAQSDFYRKTNIIVLHCLPDSVKSALIEGDFKTLMTPAMREDGTMPKQLMPLRLQDTMMGPAGAEKAERPVIYSQFHVDRRTDKAPTPREYDQILTKLMLCAGGNVRLYLTNRRVPEEADDRTANEVVAIDKVLALPKPKNVLAFTPYTKLSEAKRGIRRYIHKEAQLDTLLKWIRVMRDRLNSIPAQRWDVPLECPLTKTGWTMDPVTRRWAHWRHDGSANVLMCLVDAVTRHLFPNKQYRWWFLIIMDVIHDTHRFHAEHLVSRLASSYVSCTGMNGTLGGKSVNSAREAADKVWEDGIAGHAQRVLSSAQAERQKLDRIVKDVAATKVSQELLEETEAAWVERGQMREDGRALKAESDADREAIFLQGHEYLWCVARDVSRLERAEAFATDAETLAAALSSLTIRSSSASQ